MSYIFPKRNTRGDQMPDPEDFNEDFIPAAEKLSGRLNAHDLAGPDLKVNADVASNAYYKPYYNQVESDPDFGDNTGYSHTAIGSLPANTDLLVPNGGWTALTNISHTDVSIGNGKLWVVGWAQYIYHSFVTTTPGHVALAAGLGSILPLRVAGVEFAIRVDGQIVPESVTGHTLDWQRFIEPLKPQVQRDGTKASKKRNPGPGLTESSAIRGIGPQAMPVRVTCSIDVLEGTHTVEMVARVLAKDNPALYSAVSLQVGIHNRKLFVLGCPQVPASAPSRVATTVPSLNPGDSISAQTFYTDRVDKLADAYNDISEGDLARGALMNAHLPPAYLDQTYTEILPSSDQTVNCLYPGYGDATVSGAKNTPGTAGWWPLDDGGGPAVFLRSDNDAARTPGLDIDTTTQNTWIIVMANVQLRAIQDNTNPRRVDELAAFTLMHREDTSGTYTNVSSSEAIVNRFVNWGDIGGNAAELDIEVDVPLFHVYDFSSSVPANFFDHIGVYGSGMFLNSGGTPTSPDVIYRRGSLTVIQIRA